jgi:hypothetical protein
VRFAFYAAVDQAAIDNAGAGARPVRKQLAAAGVMSVTAEWLERVAALQLDPSRAGSGPVAGGWPGTQCARPPGNRTRQPFFTMPGIAFSANRMSVNTSMQSPSLK